MLPTSDDNVRKGSQTGSGKRGAYGDEAVAPMHGVSGLRE